MSTLTFTIREGLTPVAINSTDGARCTDQLELWIASKSNCCTAEVQLAQWKHLAIENLVLQRACYPYEKENHAATCHFEDSSEAVLCMRVCSLCCIHSQEGGSLSQYPPSIQVRFTLPPTGFRQLLQSMVILSPYVMFSSDRDDTTLS